MPRACSPHSRLRSRRGHPSAGPSTARCVGHTRVRGSGHRSRCGGLPSGRRSVPPGCSCLSRTIRPRAAARAGGTKGTRAVAARTDCTASLLCPGKSTGRRCAVDEGALADPPGTKYESPTNRSWKTVVFSPRPPRPRGGPVRGGGRWRIVARACSRPHHRDRRGRRGPHRHADSRPPASGEFLACGRSSSSSMRAPETISAQICSPSAAAAARKDGSWNI